MKDFITKNYNFIMKIYHKFNDRYLDYRYKIPNNAGLCFAYYLLMSIVPICSILAFLASIMNVNLAFVRDFLRKFLTDDFSNIIISALISKEIKLSAIISIGVSFWVVSKGINQLYGITKNLFPAEHERNFIIDYAITLFKTVFIFILMLIIISLLSFLPLINAIFPINSFVLFDDIYLFFVFFIILFMFYKIIPDVHVNIKDILSGTFVASALLTILLALLGLYFSISNYNNVYGSFATVAILLFSFNFIAEIIYIGLYVMFERHMKRLIIEIEIQMGVREATPSRIQKIKNYIKNKIPMKKKKTKS